MMDLQLEIAKQDRLRCKKLYLSCELKQKLIFNPGETPQCAADLRTAAFFSPTSPGKCRSFSLNVHRSASPTGKFRA